MRTCRLILVLYKMLQFCSLVRSAAAARLLPRRGRAIPSRCDLIVHNIQRQYQRSERMAFTSLPLTFWQLRTSFLLHPSNSSKRSIASSSMRHQHLNRFERFRTCIKAKLESSSCQDNNAQDLMSVAKTTMEMLSSSRRSFNRTWTRMSPLMELVLSASMQDCEELNSDNKMLSRTKLRSIADIGCDHGLLSLSLASMAWSTSQSLKDKENTIRCLSKVTGSDISSSALSGALFSLNKINESLSRKPIVDGKLTEEESLESVKLPVDFRVGNGLSTLQTGEADGVILAGMGVHTMIEILTGCNDLDRLDTNYLFLQPTNSRPRHLLMLYAALQEDTGPWELRDENVVYLGGRWYINAHFKRRHPNSMTTFLFPGHFLKTKDDETAAIYESYVMHHINWLKQNYNSKGSLEVDDCRWLQHLSSNQDNREWKDALEWYRPNKM